MAPFLPRFAVFKSKFANKYLRYIEEEGRDFRCLKFDGEEIISPFVKFRIVRAKTNPELYHIQSCYSNKYWRRSSSDADYIVAKADKPDEDETKWTCTLFKPLHADSDQTILRFQHVQLGNNVWFNRSNNIRKAYLIARYTKPESDGADLFQVINWEFLVILPKYVAFKGDNGKYLQWRGGIDDDQHMEFGADDIGSIRVLNEITTNFDGTIRVELQDNRRFWEATPNWIYPVCYEPKPTPASTFLPVNLGKIGKDNVIALKSKLNDKFLRRTEYEGTVDCLAAAEWATTIDKEAHLQVEEPVIKREVYDVKFHLKDIRVYNEQIILLATDEDINNTDAEKKSTLTLAYQDSVTSIFNTSSSVNVGVNMDFSASIPVLEGAVEVGIYSNFNYLYGKNYEWGEEKTTSNNLTASFSYVIPPKTKVNVELIATKGVCDVPFSFAQRDTYTNGRQLFFWKSDGVYTGSNYFGFNFMVREEPVN